MTALIISKQESRSSKVKQWPGLGYGVSVLFVVANRFITSHTVHQCITFSLPGSAGVVILSFFLFSFQCLHVQKIGIPMVQETMPQFYSEPQCFATELHQVPKLSVKYA